MGNDSKNNHKEPPPQVNNHTGPTSKVLDHSKSNILPPEVTISEPQIAYISQEPTTKQQVNRTPLSKLNHYSTESTSSSYATNSNASSNKNNNVKDESSKNPLLSIKPKTGETKKANKSNQPVTFNLTEDFMDPLHFEPTRPLAGKFQEEPKIKTKVNQMAESTPPEATPSLVRHIGPGTPHKVYLDEQENRNAASSENNAVTERVASKPPGSSNDSTTNQGSFSQQRNSEFHILFPNLPIDELLIADYGCALQKGTLVQGRIYLTQGLLSFYSSFFGWTNKITIPLSEIVGIEKRHVAYVIPSAIQVATLHHKYIFTSFRNRDAVLIQLNTLWLNARPSNNTGLEHSRSQAEDSAESDYEEVDYAGKSIPDAEPDIPKETVDQTPTDTTKLQPSPITVKPEASTCQCESSEHHDLNLEANLNGSPTKVYDLLYQNYDGWYKAFLNEDQSEVVVNDWEGATRQVTFVKPLDNPLGPKCTRCIVNQKIIYNDLPNSVTVEDTVESLDVPSGPAFRALFRVCLSHNGQGGTRLLVTGGITWLKSSWIKGPIERGVIDGHSKYFNRLSSSLESYLGAELSSSSDKFKESSNPASSSGARSEHNLTRRRRVRRNTPSPKPETFPHNILAMIMASSTMIWEQLAPVREWGWDMNRKIGLFIGNLSLVGLGIAIFAAIMINWQHASKLEAQLRDLRSESFYPPDASLENTLDIAVSDILRFATNLRRSVIALDQHIELVTTLSHQSQFTPNSDEQPQDEFKILSSA